MEFVVEGRRLIFLTGVNCNFDGDHPAPNSFGEFLFERQLLSKSASPSIDKLVCIDYSPSVAGEISRLGLSPKECTLVLMEPSVVLPANYARSRHRQFGRIITVGGPVSGGSPSVHWPLLWPLASKLREFQATQRVNRVVLIHGNKISFIKGERYSLRRRSIHAIGTLDLFGTNWDSSIASRSLIAIKSFAQAVLSFKLPSLSGLSLWFQEYPFSKGPVEDKIGTMAKYKYALVIENSGEYMSEKLMESLFAGCIPIYVGPDPEKYGIPEGLVLRADPNLASILKGLKEAEGWDINQFQSKLSEFLSSDATRNLWDHRRVYERFLLKIQRST